MSYTRRVHWRYRVATDQFATAPEAVARAMEAIERDWGLDAVARANEQRRDALDALVRGEPWMLGDVVLIEPVR